MPKLAKVPVTILTGFLGSGKTTLIRHLLQNAEGRRLAVLVNEFGTVGVDGEILRGCANPDCPDSNIIELANGCLCCTVADDFIPTMEKLLAGDQSIDHILIETSGLALPKPLLKAFNWPEIKSRITVDGVIALCDAEAVAFGRFAPNPQAVDAARLADPSLDHETPLSEVFEDQIACADLIVLTKPDLAGAEGLAQAKALIEAELTKATPMLVAEEGKISAEVLLGLNSAAEDDLLSRPCHHDGHDDHEHDDFETMVVMGAVVNDADAFVARLERICVEQNVLRVKGYVEVAGKPMRLLVQGVGGRIRAQFDGMWGASRQSGLVFIAEHDVMNEQTLQGVFA